jgi:hypothetical protein
MVGEYQEKQLFRAYSGELDCETYLRLAEVMINAIPNDRKSMRAGKVMVYLASETQKAASQNQMPPRVPTKAIHVDLDGNPNQEPSAWLSPIWKEIEVRYYPEIEARLIELARQAGLGFYPVLEKDDGKPAFYRLAAKEVPGSEDLSATNEEEIPDGTLIYKRDLTLKLSLLGKLVFEDGLRWTASKRWGFLTWQLSFFIVAASLVILAWLVLWHRTTPLTGQDVVLLAVAIGFPVAAYKHSSGIFQLFDQRIMLASEWFLSWKELGATVEINRSKDPDAPSTIHVHRYSAECPICGWMVKLDRGEPDFPGRIVGRCEENPGEHVFSFDRSSKQGRLVL